MKKPSRKFWLLLLKIGGTLYIVYLLAGFFVVPKVIDHVLENRVSEQLDRSINLEEASFNPFTLSLELIGLKVEDDDGQAFVEVGRLFSNPQLFPILTRRISVKEFALSDTIIRLKLETDGTLNIDQLLQVPESEGEEQPSDPFRFSVGLIDIANVSLEIADYTRTLPLEETIGPVTFVAEGLRSDPNSDSPYDFAAKLGDQTTIKWKGDVSLNPVASSGAFSIENLDISKTKSFWHDTLRAEVAGLFSLSGTYGLKMDMEGESAFLKEGSLVLSGFSLDDPEEDTQVDFEEIRIDGIEADWPSNRVVVESVTVSKPNALIVRHEAGEILTPMRDDARAVEANSDTGKSEAAALDLTALVKSFSVDGGTVRVVDRAISNDPEISVTGIDLRASNIAPFDSAREAQFDLDLLVNGSGAANVSAVANIPNQVVKGTFTLDGLDLATFQNYVELYSNAEIESGQLTLNVEYEAVVPNSAFDIEANVDLGGLHVKELNGGSVFEATSISIRNAFYNSEGVAVDRIELDRPVTSIFMDEEGLSLSRLAKSDEVEIVGIPEGSDEEPTKTPVSISIKEVAIVEGKTDFVDSTLTPSFRSSMTGFNLDAKNISSAKGEKAAVSIAGSFDGGGAFSFAGDLEPLDFKNYSSLKLDLSSFDLSATAPYWRKYLGRGLDKGMLNVAASFDISKSILDGSNGIMIDQLTLGEKVESEDSLGLPIGLAVAILKDRQGKMELPPLKLSGDLEDPSISISGIVMKALGNIIVKIATSPFSILGGIGGDSGDQDLSTVLFVVGQTDLNANLQSQLDKMAKILEERPGLKVDLSSTLDEETEVELLQRTLISNKPLSEESAGTVTDDPIALLKSYNAAGYEAKAIAVYRSLKKIPDSQLEDELETEPDDVPNETAEKEAQVEEEPARKGLIGSMGTFIKKVVGPKENTEDSPIVEDTPEVVKDSTQEVTDELVVELPPFEEIETYLIAQDEFQVDASWLEELAKERATNVKEYLVATKGIDASRVFISSKASDEVTEEQSRPVSAVKFELTD